VENELHPVLTLAILLQQLCLGWNSKWYELLLNELIEALRRAYIIVEKIENNVHERIEFETKSVKIWTSLYFNGYPLDDF